MGDQHRQRGCLADFGLDTNMKTIFLAINFSKLVTLPILVSEKNHTFLLKINLTLKRKSQNFDHFLTFFPDAYLKSLAAKIAGKNLINWCLRQDRVMCVAKFLQRRK